MITSHYKLDLHTHSRHSQDGGITEADYRLVLEEGKLDTIAVTDHDDISFAVWLEKKLGERIIIGEEIKTAVGEVIGLFLKKRVLPKQSLEETFAHITEQGGIIYLPHPFCHNRFGVSEQDIVPFVKSVAIVEHFNPRNIVHTDNDHALEFAKTHKKAMAASSDAHCASELGRTYSLHQATPKKDSFIQQFTTATYVTRYTPFTHLFCPKKNVLKKKLGIQ